MVAVTQGDRRAAAVAVVVEQNKSCAREESAKKEL